MNINIEINKNLKLLFVHFLLCGHWSSKLLIRSGWQRQWRGRNISFQEDFVRGWWRVTQRFFLTPLLLRKAFDHAQGGRHHLKQCPQAWIFICWKLWTAWMLVRRLPVCRPICRRLVGCRQAVMWTGRQLGMWGVCSFEKLPMGIWYQSTFSLKTNDNCVGF